MLWPKHSRSSASSTAQSMAAIPAHRLRWNTRGGSRSATSLAITDGFPLFSAAVRDEYLSKYLADIVPDWAGSHMLWWWFRYREQHVFWPWNKHEGANRADQDVPNLDFLQRGTREILVAGNTYQNPYAAAFLHEGIPCVNDIMKGPVPVCFGARQGDSIFPALARMPKKAWLKEFKRDKRDAAMEELELFRQYPAKGEPPPPPDVSDLPDRVTIRYAAVGGQQIALRSAGDHHPGPPVILLHQFPGSASTSKNCCSSLAPNNVPLPSIYRVTAIPILPRITACRVTPPRWPMCSRTYGFHLRTSTATTPVRRLPSPSHLNTPPPLRA